MKKDSIFREYWYMWMVVIFLPIALYCVIHQPWGFDAIGGEDAPKVWLGFWGGYLGAIISASVAFFILDKQIKASKKENEDNRTANETQNETNRTANKRQNEENRTIQIKTVQYQQKLQWLNDFKKVAAEYISVFNTNDLVVAHNFLRTQPTQTYDITKLIFDNLIIVKTKMALFKADDEHANELYEKLLSLYEKFKSVANDIHKSSTLMIAYYNRNNPNDLSFMQRYMIESIRNLQNGYSEEIKALIAPETRGLDEYQIEKLAIQRRNSVDMALKDVSSLIVAYVTEEQKRINSILL
ncbi:MAG: hypothetical protein RSF40_08590 [Oscillospiraceae bacterium]